MYMLVLLVILIQQGLAFKCYNCHSENGEDCVKDQIPVQCENGKENCYTLLYEKEVNVAHNKTVITYGMQKACARNDCRETCHMYYYLGHRCKVTCCSNELCNINSIDPRMKSVIKSNVKRSKVKIEEKKSTRNSTSSKHSSYSLVVFGIPVLYITTHHL